MLLYVYIYFIGIFVVFHNKICVFIIFISFFDKDFRNRILANQKHELVVSNCQRNCMLVENKFKTFLDSAKLKEATKL